MASASAIGGAGASADRARPRKNLALAAVLSFVVCGLGQIYNGEPLRGGALFISFVVLLVVFRTVGSNFTIGLLACPRPLDLRDRGCLSRGRADE